MLAHLQIFVRPANFIGLTRLVFVKSMRAYVVLKENKC